MSNREFNETWKCILTHSNKTFYTKSGLEFTYQIKGDGFYTSRTNYRISKADFRKAYDIFPIEGPGDINEIVRGPAYVWAVLRDQRILSNG